MERIKIFVFSLILILFASAPVCFAEDGISMSTLVTPQEVSFASCTKTYNMSPDKLFYLAIASANANRFKIDELQSKAGYILFTAVNKQFLASVVKVDASRSQLKITPTNNVYYFPPGIVLNFFKYIEFNASVPIAPILPEA